MPRHVTAALLLSLVVTFPALAFDLDELGARLSTPAALQGRFEQRSWLEDQQTQLHSEGRFLYQRGIRVVWQMHTPEETLQAFYADMTLPPAWGDDDTEDDQAELMLANRFAFAEQLTYLIGGDWAALSEYYRIDLEGESDAWQVRLTPLAPPLEGWLGTLTLKGKSRVDEITLEAANGDELTVQFENQRSLVDIGLQAFISQWLNRTTDEDLEEPTSDSEPAPPEESDENEDQEENEARDEEESDDEDED